MTTRRRWLLLAGALVIAAVAAPNSAFGSHGNLIFDVKGPTGMGVHSGRADKGGPTHKTEGCIRTTDEAMKALLEFHKKDALQSITVKD